MLGQESLQVDQSLTARAYGLFSSLFADMYDTYAVTLIGFEKDMHLTHTVLSSRPQRLYAMHAPLLCHKQSRVENAGRT